MTSHLDDDVPGIPRYHRGRPRGEPAGSTGTYRGSPHPAAGTGARAAAAAGASRGVWAGAPGTGSDRRARSRWGSRSHRGRSAAPTAAPSHPSLGRRAGGRRVTPAAPAPGISCTPGVERNRSPVTPARPCGGVQGEPRLTPASGGLVLPRHPGQDKGTQWPLPPGPVGLGLGGHCRVPMPALAPSPESIFVGNDRLLRAFPAHIPQPQPQPPALLGSTGATRDRGVPPAPSTGQAKNSPMWGGSCRGGGPVTAVTGTGCPDPGRE